MDASQIAILEKELELEKLQASILQKELILLKAKGNAYEQGTSSTVKTEKVIVSEQPKPFSQLLTPQVPKKTYAIFNGPRKGVYSSYPQDISERDIVKEFASEFEARYIYNQQHGQLNEYKDAIMFSQTPSKMQPIGNIPQVKAPIFRKGNEQFTEELWLQNYNALLTGKKKEGIYPIYKNGLIKTIIYPGAQPGSVYELFNQGLIDTIYLSPTYSELDHFNLAYKNTIGMFVKKTKTQKQIYLKFESSIPDFDKEKTYHSFHLIRIGPVGSNPAINELRPEAPITSEEIMDRRLLSLDNITSELLRFKPNQEFKVNMVSKNTIIYSHFNKKVSENDWAIIKNWTEMFSTGSFEVSPKTIEAYNEKPMEEDEAHNKKPKTEGPTKPSAETNKESHLPNM